MRMGVIEDLGILLKSHDREEHVFTGRGKDIHSGKNVVVRAGSLGMK